MKKSICHYSFHRRWEAERWTVERVAREAVALGLDGVDFHAGMLGEREGAVAAIRAALKETRLRLSGLSLSNSFTVEDDGELRQQVDGVRGWLAVAAELKAPVVRVFGGHADRSDAKQLEWARERVTEALGEVAKDAEKCGLVLALENHGCMPGTGEEQAGIIEDVGSSALRATVDVGNYLAAQQDPRDGTRAAAPHCAYVHLKDFRRVDPGADPEARSLQPCTLGTGDVDVRSCLEELKKAGYDGYVALEYEGDEGEMVGIPESVKFMHHVMKDY